MSIKKTLIHFHDISLTLTPDEIKTALITKYGDAAAQVLGEDVVLQSSFFHLYQPEPSVTFTFAQPLEGHVS